MCDIYGEGGRLVCLCLSLSVPFLLFAEVRVCCHYFGIQPILAFVKRLDFVGSWPGRLL